MAAAPPSAHVPPRPAPAHRAEVEVGLDDEAQAEAVAGAISVEADEGPEGTRLRVGRSGARVVLELEAASLADLRAALNSAVRLADAAAATLRHPDHNR